MTSSLGNWQTDMRSMMDQIMSGGSSPSGSVGRFTIGGTASLGLPISGSTAGGMMYQCTSSNIFAGNIGGLNGIQPSSQEIVFGDSRAPEINDVVFLGTSSWSLTSGSLPMGGVTTTTLSTSFSAKNRYHNFQGQDLEEFEVGDLVEIVPTIPDQYKWPYLPTTHKAGPNQRAELFRLEKIEPGMVVRKYVKNLKEIFDESLKGMNERNEFAYDLATQMESGLGDIKATILVVLIDEMVVEIHSPRCDPSRSLMVRRRELDAASEPDPAL